MAPLVLVRGGGDLASGVILRLARSGIRVIVCEIAQPLAVRRLVAFAEAVYAGEIMVEDVPAHSASGVSDALHLASQGIVPVMVDPFAESRIILKPVVIIDGRMTKRPPELGKDAAPLVIGLGPGFAAGENCHAVIETQRGPFLGRAIWQGKAAPDTGEPDTVSQVRAERVLRAPDDGIFVTYASIGDHLAAGQVIAEVNSQLLAAPFSGLLRGLLHSGIRVARNLKVGDLDPRNDPRLCRLVSDKALAIGGGVLEVLLTRPEIRTQLWMGKSSDAVS